MAGLESLDFSSWYAMPKGKPLGDREKSAGEVAILPQREKHRMGGSDRVPFLHSTHGALNKLGAGIKIQYGKYDVCQSWPGAVLVQICLD